MIPAFLSDQEIEKLAKFAVAHVRRAHRITEEEAEDAVQDAFCNVLRSKSQWRGDSAFSSWFMRIALNCSGMALRKKYGTSHRQFCELSPMTPVPAEQLFIVARNQKARRVRNALDRLTPRRRETLVRLFLQDEPMREVASDLGVPVETVKARAFKGREKMRELLKREAA